ncbi:MAG TPA: winged helix-turn-helix domain-containing protein [Vicinamibacterales bacterium]|nr:winged helix-turn-helix domain-containing protein [Vicinamibacterales bacterium]
MTFRFGPFRADRVSYRVFEGERALELTPKLLDLLFYLIERPATLVTKEELLENVWPGANVTDNALAQAISDLRDALNDSPSAPTYIRTVARRGYRFVAPVEAESGPRESSGSGSASPTGRLTTPEVLTPEVPPALAVLDFANVTGDPDVAWLGAGIAETVTSDLATLDHFRVIDRWRVVQAGRRTAGSMHDIASAVGASLIVTGSYQRIGSHLRITARLVDLASSEAVADAKVDGLLEDVFGLQDGITLAFARDLGLPVTSRAGRLGVRETSSLEAYRAYTEGWLKIESLDTTLISDSIRDFERAIAIDPRYAIAYTGIANAEFVAYELTRADRAANLAALASGIEHARHAIHLDDRLAEAHATLSFLLSSASKFDEAKRAGQQAVAIEPDNWRHQYRLGHACWGETRLNACERALALYPQFAYAQLEMAMVFVARGDLETADDIVRQGVAGQDRQARTSDRFPAIGFHWLLGTLRAARGDEEGAIAQFNLELSQVHPRRLYGPEYAAAALVSRGHAELALGQSSRARETFSAALTHVPGYGRACVGLSLADARRGDASAVAVAREATREAIATLDQTSRAHEARMIAACDAAAHDEPARAVEALEQVLTAGPPSVLGWTVPVEPCFRPLAGHSGFARVLARLAERAR